MGCLNSFIFLGAMHLSSLPTGSYPVHTNIMRLNEHLRIKKEGHPLVSENPPSKVLFKV
jgi:hypothetical protein